MTLATATPMTARDALGLAAPYLAPRSTIEEALTGIWAAAFALDRVGIRDDFFKLGGDSLKAATVFALIEERFGQKLPLAILLRKPTIEALAGAIKSDEGAAAAPLDILVPIRTEGTRPPLFMIHGGAGLIHLWPDWLAAIGEDQPVYGLEARGSRDEALPHETVEAMAADYLGVIRAVHPQGPFFLAGICIGGMIAFEMAQQLLAAGEPPLALLLMDPLAQALRPEGAEGDLDALRRTTAGQAFLDDVRGRVKALVRLRRIGSVEEERSQRLIRSLIRVQDGINAAANAYILKPYPRFIHFFCSTDHQRMMLANARGWNSAAAGKARLWPVAPDHHSMFAEHSALLAKCMRKAMDAALNPAAQPKPRIVAGIPVASTTYGTIVPLNGARGRPPLFLVHGGLGHIFLDRAMVDALGPDQPLLGIEPRGLRVDSPPHTSVEDMAAGYVSLIREMVPRGPYLLGGICMGSIVAYEMALQLVSGGEDILALLMIDPAIINAAEAGTGRNAATPVDGFFGSLNEMVDAARKYLAPFRAQYPRIANESDEAVDRGIQRALDIQKAIQPALTRYRPKPLPGAVDFICSMETAQSLREDRGGWRRAVGPQSRLWVAGNSHREIFEAQAGRVGRIMRRAIDDGRARAERGRS